VSFALEVTGACLTLPLEDVELMNMSVNMLTRWYAPVARVPRDSGIVPFLHMSLTHCCS
jgi:hypothetical protein